VRRPSDGDRPATPAQLVEKRHRLTYFGLRRPTVRPGPAAVVRVSRDDVPEQHVLGEAELVERPLHDRRRGLGRAPSGDLPLGRERQPADACAAVAGGLADQEIAGLRVTLEVLGEPVAPELRPRVLVERLTDPRLGEAVDERAVQGALAYEINSSRLPSGSRK
jgi:hypothetical protein